MRNVLAVAAVVLLAGCLKAPPPVGHLVPVLSPAPELDEALGPDEWSDTLELRGTFSIRDGTAATGDYPFALRLGHDDKWLYALARVKVPPHPFKDIPEPGVRSPWAFGMFLIGPGESRLEAGTDWKYFVNFGKVGSSYTLDGYWDGTEWIIQAHGSHPGAPWEGNRPTGNTWGRGWEHGDELIWEIFIPLSAPNPAQDGFRARPGDGFRLGLLFEVQGIDSPDRKGPIHGPRDTYPGDGYTPNGHYDPTGWIPLVLAPA